jgi:hypothetical protein
LVEVRRWLLDAYHKVPGRVLAAWVILRDYLLLLLLLHVDRLGNNVTMVYRVYFAIIIHQEALGINAAILNHILDPSIISVQVSQIVTHLNRVLGTCSLNQSIGGLAVPGNNYILLC